MKYLSNKKGFLGIDGKSNNKENVVIIPFGLEKTVSYGGGTSKGPNEIIKASHQVELFDEDLDIEPYKKIGIKTIKPFPIKKNIEEALKQIENINRFLLNNNKFPLVLGGEHGSLPAQMRALSNHPNLNNDLGKLTIVQIDAHADLRDELDGENFSHACAARRSLDEGVGKSIQIGVRAYSREENEFIVNDERVNTWFARDFMSPCGGEKVWRQVLDEISSIKGQVWLTLDIDGLDGKLVPNTGTPVPGGLTYWQTVEIIETLFSAREATIIGADVAEIVPGENNNVTQFTAAMLATKIIAAHISTL